ncbi:MAG: energy transducer TonB [Candidatus Babeliales bacterium]
MQQYREPENKKMFFLLSLLVHLLLLYLFFLCISYHNSNKTVVDPRSDAQKDPNQGSSQPAPAPGTQPDKPQDPKEEEKKASQELAELKARQSAFGAPVVFEDMPESVPTLAVNKDHDGPGDEEQELVEDQPDATTKKQEAVVVAQKASPKQQVEKDLALAKNRASQASDGTSFTVSENLLQETIEALENKNAQERQEQITKKRTRRRRTPSKKSDTTTALNEGNSQRSAGPTNKKFTFADLANGFLENLQSGGKDAINQRGNPNIRPGIEQLKQASYREKMAWNLQAAFKRAARRTKFITPSPEFNRLECTFYIAKSGELEKLDVLSGTGHQELDSFIVTTIKDAFPLPPIPDHWAQDMLVQTWVFRNIQPNESSYVVNF